MHVIQTDGLNRALRKPYDKPGDLTSACLHIRDRDVVKTWRQPRQLLSRIALRDLRIVLAYQNCRFHLFHRDISKYEIPDVASPVAIRLHTHTGIRFFEMDPGRPHMLYTA